MQSVSKLMVIVSVLLLMAVLMSLLFVSGGSVTTTSAQEPAADVLPLSEAGLAVLAGLNEWRIAQGLWPFTLNDNLTEIAQAHADYLIALPALPKGGDIHIDGQGRRPAQRAYQDLSWPAYSDNPDRVAVGEVAYVGASDRRAIEYWQGSDIHNRTVTNGAYREAGVGVVPHPYGNLFIVVLGARPDVLPAAYDPLENELYLSQETYQYAAGATTLQSVTQLQLAPDESSFSDTNWQSWSATVPWENSGAERVVFYGDGVNRVSFAFDPVRDVVWTPQLLRAVQDGRIDLTPPERKAPVVVSTPAAPDSTQSSDTVGLPTAFPTNTPPFVTAEPTILATAFPTNTPLPTAAPTGEPDVILLYNQRAFTLFNATNGPLNLSAVRFEGANGSLNAPRWDTEFATASVASLPSGDCVRAWSWDDSSDHPQPPECGFVRSVLTLSPTSLFWTADFTVLVAGNPVASCSAIAERCEVYLP